MGIIIATLIPGFSTVPLLIYASACLLPFFFIRPGRRHNIIFGIVTFQFFLICGYLLFSAKHEKINSQSLLPGDYQIRADQYPQIRKKSLRLEASIKELSKGSHSIYKKKIILYFPPGSEIINAQPGNIIKLSLKPGQIRDFDTTDNFDYGRYMLYRGFRYSSWVQGNISITGSKKQLSHRALILRKKLLDKYASKIRIHKSLSIVSALSLGYRDTMQEEVKLSFRDAGISHIMAVSGLHVGIVSLIFISLLKVLRIRHKTSILMLSICAVWFFALLSGMSVSVARASIMFSFIYAGRTIARNINPLNSLFASAFIILLIDPFAIFSLSFQLSYSAVIVILLFYRRLNGLFSFSGILLSRCWSLVSLTLLAQAGTLPIVLYQFRSLPLLSVITNIFAIPLAFCILLSGFLFLFCPSGFFLSDILARLIEFETLLLYYISELIASIPGTVLTLDS